jgi:exopolysaccharide biosynthesis polyprenyl glycosylphosphotransferase
MADIVKNWVRRNWRTTSALISFLIDVTTLAIAFFVAASSALPNDSLYILFISHKKLLAFVLIIFPTAFTFMGIYRRASYSNLGRQIVSAAKGFVLGTAALLSALYLSGNIWYTRSFVFNFLLLFAVLYVVVWFVAQAWFSMMREAGYGRSRTLVIGDRKGLKPILARIDAYPQLGYDVVDKMVLTGKKPTGTLRLNLKQVKEIVSGSKIQLIVLSTTHLNGSFEKLEELCEQKEVSLRVLSEESDDLFHGAQLHDFAGIPIYDPPRRRIEVVKRFTKRLFDLVIGSVVLLLLSPVFLVIGILIKLESRGPVFFKQKRALVDKQEPFHFYKFRSMKADADTMKVALKSKNESDGALFKMKDDPRITKVGKVIRRFSLDELPQLFNVLKGEMSLVGPRPLPVDDYKWLKKSDHMGGYFRLRSKAKPGITGLWQISGRSHLGFREMVLLDLYYVENQTIMFDLEILGRTIPAVFFGRGAY